MEHDLDVGVGLEHRLLGRLRLGLPDVGLPVDDLALEVGLVDLVELRDADRPDAGRGEVEQRGAAEAAGADDQHLGVLEPLLPGHADVGDDQVPAVAAYLVDRQLVGGLHERRRTHGGLLLDQIGGRLHGANAASADHVPARSTRARRRRHVPTSGPGPEVLCARRHAEKSHVTGREPLPRTGSGRDCLSSSSGPAGQPVSRGTRPPTSTSVRDAPCRSGGDAREGSRRGPSPHSASASDSATRLKRQKLRLTLVFVPFGVKVIDGPSIFRSSRPRSGPLGVAHTKGTSLHRMSSGLLAGTGHVAWAPPSGPIASARAGRTRPGFRPRVTHRPTTAPARSPSASRSARRRRWRCSTTAPRR